MDWPQNKPKKSAKLRINYSTIRENFFITKNKITYDIIKKFNYKCITNKWKSILKMLINIVIRSKTESICFKKSLKMYCIGLSRKIYPEITSKNIENMPLIRINIFNMKLEVLKLWIWKEESNNKDRLKNNKKILHLHSTLPVLDNLSLKPELSPEILKNKRRTAK